LTSAGIATIEAYASSITQQYTRAKLANELRLTNIYTMGMRVHKLATTYAYADIMENTTPSDAYLNSRFEVCKELIALAGYRLVDHLNKHL